MLAEMGVEMLRTDLSGAVGVTLRKDSSMKIEKAGRAVL
jgi:hypothetical protein